MALALVPLQNSISAIVSFRLTYFSMDVLQLSTAVAASFTLYQRFHDAPAELQSFTCHLQRVHSVLADDDREIFWDAEEQIVVM